MSAHKPEEIHDLFAVAFAAGDLDGLLSLYEPHAVFAPRPGPAVSGQVAIREALAGFFQLNAQLTLRVERVLQSGELALLISHWTLNGTDPNGNKVEQCGTTSDVARRQPDGTWLLVIDNPYGTA